jgi:hypothetical protein
MILLNAPKDKSRAVNTKNQNVHLGEKNIQYSTTTTTTDFFVENKEGKTPFSPFFSFNGYFGLEKGINLEQLFAISTQLKVPVINQIIIIVFI